MEYTHVLLRYGELFLKGKNRKDFERRLLENIRKLTKQSSVERTQARSIMGYFSEHSLLKNVFGLTSYSLCISSEKDVENIKQKILLLLEGIKGSFKVETKRSDKRFPIKSPDMNRKMGEFIEENSELFFEMKDPDHIINIEINQKGVYLFVDRIMCFGGLPVGTEGKAALLVEGDDSILAGVLMMKRGVSIVPFALQEIDISLLKRFSPSKLELQKVRSYDEVEGLVVVGDSFDSMKEFNDKVVLRPLIGFTSLEIKEELEKFSY